MSQVQFSPAAVVVVGVLIVAIVVALYFYYIGQKQATMPAAPPGSTAVMPETQNGEQRALENRGSPTLGEPLLYSRTALILRMPAEEDSSLIILK